MNLVEINNLDSEEYLYQSNMVNKKQSAGTDIIDLSSTWNGVINIIVSALSHPSIIIIIICVSR